MSLEWMHGASARLSRLLDKKQLIFLLLVFVFSSLMCARPGVGYSFSANWVNAVNGSRGTSFVYVSNITSPDRTPSNVNWYDYHFPGTLNNSANSVYLNNTVAFFELENQIYAHGFVAQFTFDEAPPVPAPVPVPAPSGSDGDGGSSDPALSQGGVVAVSVVGGVVGLAVLAYAVYFVTSGTAASASAGASAGAAGGVASTVNPIATAGSANSGITMSDGTAGI